MSEQPIYVDKTPFLGRVEEQKQFIAALQDVLNRPATETLPYIFLLYGDGGIGKTTLAKRFRDIANDRPFRGKFQLLWIDWEDERRRYASLQVGRENISPEVVFDVIHAVAVRQQWGEHFKKYQKTIKVRAEAEKKAAEAVTAAEERSELSTLRGAGAGALAKLVRTQIPAVGESGEKLVQAFLDAGIKVGAEEAAKLRGALETRLRAKLKPEQFAVFLNPNEQLALALADGIKQIAAAQPLLIVLDTYEIVDRPDVWLRSVIRAAGPRVLWIISGRNDLVKNRLFGTEYFKGYPDDFPRRLLAYDMRQLAIEDIQNYFAARVPERPITTDNVEAISRATRGIPLAVRQAADIWQRGTDLADLVGDTTDHTSRAEIVQKMTERYLLHVIAETDKQAIYALALARGDVEILRAMLRPDNTTIFDLDALLHRLERDYASVHAERARLHDEPAMFFQAYLRADVRRGEDRVRSLNQRAAAAVRERLKSLEADLPLIEDRHENEDWIKATLDLTYYLFWLDETEVWHWFIPRFVESLAYSRELRRGLVDIADDSQDCFSPVSKKRLKALRPSADRTELEDDEALLTELTQLETAGWLKGNGEAERRAILDWRRGQLLYRQQEYDKALDKLQNAERQLPTQSEVLRKQLAQSFDRAGWELGLERGTAIPSAKAESALRSATELCPDVGAHWVGLGVMQYGLKRFEEASKCIKHGIELGEDEGWAHNWLGNVCDELGRTDEAIAEYQRAIELDPEYAHPHNGLGNVYATSGRADDAIAAYQRAIELDPQDNAPHNGLGNIYRHLGRTDEAIAECQRAIELDPKDGTSHNNLGVMYADLGRTDEAITEYQRAIELDPKWATPHDNLGDVYRDLGHTDEAIAAYQRAIELDPKFAYPHNGLGNVYRDLGCTDDALAEYQRAIELDPKFAEPHYGLGNVYRDLGRTDDALAELEKAIDLDPKLAAPHQGLGIVCQLLGQPEKALTEFKKAVELEPKDGSFRSSLIGMLKKLGRETEAAEHIAIARELIAKANEYNRACFEAICGNVDEALTLLKIALEKKQASLAWVRCDPDFESIRSDPRFIDLVGEAEKQPSTGS